MSQKYETVSGKCEWMATLFMTQTNKQVKLHPKKGFNQFNLHKVPLLLPHSKNKKTRRNKMLGIFIFAMVDFFILCVCVLKRIRKKTKIFINFSVHPKIIRKNVFSLPPMLLIYNSRMSKENWKKDFLFSL